MRGKRIIGMIMAGCLCMMPMLVHAEETQGKQTVLWNSQLTQPVAVQGSQTAQPVQTTDLLNARFVFTKSGYTFEKSVLECVVNPSTVKTNMDIYQSLIKDTTKLDLYLEALNQVFATIPEEKPYFYRDAVTGTVLEGTAVVTFRTNDSVKKYIYEQLVNHVAGAAQGNVEIPLDRLALNATTVDGVDLTGSIATLLGEYTTSYRTSAAGRCTNIQVAAGNLNGTYVQPGETISVSTIFKPRTAENGYQMGGIFLNGETVPGMGGGICQVSTTTYVASLNAGMNIVERHKHSLPVSYVPSGMDATISGMTLDLKIRNDFAFPVYYKTVTQDKTVTVQVYQL